MAQTVGETRAYKRGYNRAGQNYWKRAQRVIEIARGYSRRLSDTDSLRVCENCDRWKRGSPRTHWGYCRADFAHGIEARMWADVETGGKVLRATIVTQPEFGCVSWIPKEATDA